jgi:outer membrane protein TolC
VLAYRKNVMGALKDVEDALVRLGADRHRVARLRAAEAEALDAADTNRVRYRNGLISFVEVLQAQQTWFNARDASAQGQADAAQDVVALYKALGGGWDERRNPPEQETSDARGQ